MAASRPPWWFYIIAVSSLCSFPLLLYNVLWGPVDPGISFDSAGIVKEVQTNTPAAHAFEMMKFARETSDGSDNDDSKAGDRCSIASLT